MSSAKMKSLTNIEEKMAGLDAGSLRYRILENTKHFKTSWIELGQALYSVWKDKMYKEWGYSTFDVYTAKEIGIRKPTAMKLLKSYYFLEKEEPGYLKDGFGESKDSAATIPTYESIDVLRQAKNKKTLDAQDYASLKKEIFQDGKDHYQLKKDLTALIRQRQELEPEEAWEKKKASTIKRFLSTLKSLKEEIELSKLMSVSIIKDIAGLISRIESEI